MGIEKDGFTFVPRKNMTFVDYQAAADFGVEVVEIPRFAYREDREQIISATLVRKALREKDWEIIEKSCPQSTVKYLEDKGYIDKGD